MQRIAVCLRLLTILALVGGLVLAATPAVANEVEVAEVTPAAQVGEEGAASEPPSSAEPDSFASVAQDAGVALDADGDAVADEADNCAAIANADQADADGDGTGDTCEPDGDGDGMIDDLDNCPTAANPGQEDADGNGQGEACAPAPTPTPADTQAPTETPAPTETQAPPEGTADAEPPDAATPESLTAPTTAATPAAGDAGGTTGVTASVAAEQATEVAAAARAGGTLVVTTLGSRGEPLAGSCYEVYSNPRRGTTGNLVTAACDGWDGADDGVVKLTGLNGSYLLVHSQVPSGYLPAESWLFRIRAGQTLKRQIRAALGGTLAVRKVDQAGSALPGAGFELWTDAGGGALGTYVAGGYDEGDGADDGTITFTGLPTGSYVLSEIRVPTGYFGASTTSLRVKAGRIAEITVVNHLGGKLVVRKTDADGNLLAGACFGLYVDAGDGTPGAGVGGTCNHDGGALEFPGLQTGSYVLREESAPFGFVPAEDVVVGVVAGGTTTVDVANVALGKLVLHAVDQFGQTVVGACFDVPLPSGGTFVRCDGGSFPIGDGTPDGVVTIEFLDGDTHVFPSGVPAGYLLADPFVVNVQPGEVELLDVLIPLGAAIHLTTVDEAGQVLTNACINLHADAGGGTPGAFVAGACDWTDGGADGAIAFIGLLGGDYVVVESFTPSGYRPSADRAVHVELGETATLALEHLPISVLVVNKLDEADQPLPGACFAVYADSGGAPTGWPVADFCDDADGAGDGTVRRVGLEPGAYLLVETVTPPGYLPLAEPQAFTLAEGQATTVPVRNVLGGTAVVLLFGPDGLLLPGGCYTLAADAGGAPGEWLGSGCDGDDGAEDGRTAFAGLTTGDYLVLPQAPFGYFTLDLVAVHVEAGRTVEVPIDAEQAGTLVVHRTDEGGAPVDAGCFEVYRDLGDGTPGELVRVACEGMDEDPDGTSVLQGFLPGDYVVVDFFPPRGYLPIPNLTFSIAVAETVERTVVNRLGGVLTVSTVDSTGTALTGACYEAYRDAGGGTLGAFVTWACDNDFDGGSSDGTTILVGLEGDLVLRQSVVPGGYVPAANVPFAIAAGQELGQTVVNQLGATVRVVAVDETGASLVGLCFYLYLDAGDGTPAGDPVAAACDYLNDGVYDGVTTLTGLPGGNYLAVEAATPDGYLPAAPTAAPVGPAQTTTVIVTYLAAA
jgi:uncharacterized surface anchored protein